MNTPFRQEKLAINLRQDHPERLYGEVYFGNSSENGKGYGWKSTRVGHNAFDMNGKRLNGYRPIFVKAKEISEHFQLVFKRQEDADLINVEMRLG